MARRAIPAGSVAPTGQTEQITFWDREAGGILVTGIFADDGDGPGDPYPNGFVTITAIDGNYPALIAITDADVLWRQLGSGTTRTQIDTTVYIADGSITLADLSTEVQEAIEAGGGGIPAENFAQVAFTGSYGDLLNTPTIPEIPADTGAVPDGTRRWNGSEWSLRPANLPVDISSTGYSDGSNGSVRDVDATPPDGAEIGDVWWQAF